MDQTVWNTCDQGENPVLIHQPSGSGHRRPLRAVAAVLLLALAVTACMSGSRPTLAPPAVGGDSGSATGDANADAVLKKLETRDRVVFSATYQVVRAAGQVTSEASATQDASRWAATINRVRFLSTATDQTCDLTKHTCESGLLDARVSDSGVTHDFSRGQPARRLRIAITRKTAATTASTETIGGMPAVCVTVPLGNGDEVYCANDLSVIARWTAADVRVELTASSPAATDAQFSTTG